MSGIPIIGKDPDHVKAMRNHIRALEMCGEGHSVSISVTAQLLTDEMNRPEDQGPPNMILTQLMHLNITTHAAAIDNIACQMAFLHAMGVPDIPVPEIPTFVPEGVTTQ